MNLPERLRERAGAYDEYAWHKDIEMEAAAEIEALADDAARYRWLRDQHWSTAVLCVVRDPKRSCKLGTSCPSGKLLDDDIDSLRGEPK
jgi:hypothetical protein